MILNSKEIDIVNVKPMRITRIVSVILNGVVISKLAMQNGNDVDAMTDTVLLNLSENVQKNIYSREMPFVEHSLRKEIGRRVNLAQAA